jgi:hypothetical protein
MKHNKGIGETIDIDGTKLKIGGIIKLRNNNGRQPYNCSN